MSFVGKTRFNTTRPLETNAVISICVDKRSWKPTQAHRLTHTHTHSSELPSSSKHSGAMHGCKEKWRYLQSIPKIPSAANSRTPNAERRTTVDDLRSFGHRALMDALRNQRQVRQTTRRTTRTSATAAYDLRARLHTNVFCQDASSVCCYATQCGSMLSISHSYSSNNSGNEQARLANRPLAPPPVLLMTEFENTEGPIIAR
ncbi:unnamed protein product [Ceratitis capitata]|uniref:(Mediterranean fruit fly) hypothetical protein n=1 Tax=Ceratitis capitata TaxID=7213 RepID=A0A811UK44_CERCA|nr:unnamed protein product [Ceratitis capitata]